MNGQRSEVTRVLCAAVDPVVIPRGFLGGQGDDGNVTFCSNHDELSAEFPGLPQAWQQAGTHCCIDLIVEITSAGIRRADLEGQSVESMLTDFGLIAAAADLKLGLSTGYVAAADALARALITLFEHCR